MGTIRKNTLEYIKEYITSNIEGYELLSKNITPKEKIKVRCSKGHIFTPWWYNLKGGSRCPQCARNAPITLDDVKKFAIDRGYKCISEKYIHATSKLKFLCPKGHIYETCWDVFRLNYGCSTCSGNRKRPFKEIKEYIESFDYKCLAKENDYKNSRFMFDTICPKGHNWKTNSERFYIGSRCAKCANEQLSITFTAEGNPQWRGGISFGEYCPIFEKKDFKNNIKERDKHQCLNPYCFKNSKNLVIHHIDYNKKNCEENNLITLCNSCNSRANVKRVWHTMWYKTIIYKRYELGRKNEK